MEIDFIPFRVPAQNGEDMLQRKRDEQRGIPDNRGLAVPMRKAA